MKEIPLTKGYKAMVSDEDFEILSQYKWYAKISHKTVYAANKVKNGNGKRTSSSMHRMIMNPCDGKIHVDHIDGNGLNNTRENLRFCTHQQNVMNSASYCGSSKYKGVVWDKDIKMWISQIMVFRKHKHIGYFKNEEDAARAYNQQAKIHFREFARYNDVSPMFPDKAWSPQVLRIRNTSGYRGVSFEKRRGKWIANIMDIGKRRYLGQFDDPKDAAKKYDAKAIEIFGDNARLNFPKQNPI